ncbi:TonB-dependent receptor [Qipengyuania sp. JC766]|uniref:TonB-dependent receptor plug domain-containing protein n=1 Tax=Qipengyuania sp. JC766 TaxID=3232139 RepID=UPI00345AA212
MRHVLFGFCSTLAFTVPAHAQVEPSTREQVPDDTPVDPVVVSDDFSEFATDPDTITITVTGTPIEVEDTGQPVTIIGRDEIESVQGPDIARILRRAPGVTVTGSGGLGSLTSVRVRGGENDQLLVLVDGIEVNDPASTSGGFDFGNLVPGTIQSVDLLRGSNSTVWGSDAIAGVMAITTRAATGLEASAEYGARDTVYAQASGGVESDAGFIGIAGSYLTTGGVSAAASGTEPDGFEQYAITGRGRLYLGRTASLFASGRYAEGDLELDGFPPPDFTLADTGATQETRQYSGNVGVQNDAGPLFVKAAYSFADTERVNFDPGTGPGPSFTSDGHQDRIEARGEWRPIGPLLVNFGGEYEWSAFSSDSSDRVTTSIGGVYGQLGIEFGPLSGRAGLRYDDHQDFGGTASFGADFSYALADNLRLRASVGEGFKAPSLFQLNSDFGNPALDPAQSTSFDLGLAYGDRSQDGYAGLTLFRRDTENLIDFASCFSDPDPLCDDGRFGYYINVGETRAQGFEIEAGKRLGDRLMMRLAYSYVEAEDRTPGGANEGNRLARRPDHALTASVDWTGPADLTLGGDVRLVGDSFDNIGNTTALDGYVLTDLRASWPLAEQIELFGRIENLFDVDYTVAAGYGTPGRSAYIGARLRL